MLIVLSFESVEDRWLAADVARALGTLSSSLPQIDQVYISDAGAETEELISIGALQSSLADHPGYFAASLLHSGGIRPDDDFLSSVPMIIVENLPQVRGLYVICEAGSLERVARNFLLCSDSLGEGFGYIAASEDASSAMDYVLDMEVLRDLDEIEALLEPGKSWRDHLETRSRKMQARNLFPINIWPKTYLAMLEKEECFTKARETGEIRLLRECDHVDVHFAERSASAALAPLNGRLFFEELGKMDLRWLDGSHADELRITSP